LRPADLGKRTVLVEQVFQGDRVGDLTPIQKLADRRVDPAMHRIAEMLGAEKLDDPAIGRVVDQDGAQQRLLGLGVRRRLRDPVEIGLA
jgi:hypothetical protein